MTAAVLAALTLAALVIAAAYATAIREPADDDTPDWAGWHDTVPHIRALADAERAAEDAWCPASVREADGDA